MKFKKDRVQVFNKKIKLWGKVDTKSGRSLGYKNTPWKNIKKIIQKTEDILMTYELSNPPHTLKVWRNKKELKLGKDYVADIKNRIITLLN